MALDIKRVEYFAILVDGNAGEAYKLLSTFSAVGIGLLAFKAVPAEDGPTRFHLFPNDSAKMKEGANKAGLNPEGPYPAIIIKSDSDEPGECADIFRKLSHANVNVIEAIGIADIKDSYGVVLYLNPEDFERAMAALKA